jgi:adenosylcobinamide kinase/adenosylcobinamide-phosphate guanylyltransferase
MIHLVTGGARAGKSGWALARADERASADSPLAFIATAQALDPEMNARIVRHREERGPRWVTFEEPLDVPERIGGIAREHGAVVLDCLTLWTSNLLFARDDDAADAWIDGRIAALTVALAEARGDGGHVIVVTNEVGLGIVPFDPLTRRYRDHLGRCNQAVAAIADRVTLLVSGLPLTLKA